MTTTGFFDEVDILHYSLGFVHATIRIDVDFCLGPFVF